MTLMRRLGFGHLNFAKKNFRQDCGTEPDSSSDDEAEAAEVPAEAEAAAAPASPAPTIPAAVPERVVEDAAVAPPRVSRIPTPHGEAVVPAPPPARPDAALSEECATAPAASSGVSAEDRPLSFVFFCVSWSLWNVYCNPLNLSSCWARYFRIVDPVFSIDRYSPSRADSGAAHKALRRKQIEEELAQLKEKMEELLV